MCLESSAHDFAFFEVRLNRNRWEERPNSWEWESWLPFWTEEEAEQYIFEDNYLDFFGPECPPIQSSVEDWIKLKRWAEDNGHELVLVSAQRPHCEEPTTEWLIEHGFDFNEIHYTKNKWSIDST